MLNILQRFHRADQSLYLGNDFIRKLTFNRAFYGRSVIKRNNVETPILVSSIQSSISFNLLVYFVEVRRLLNKTKLIEFQFRTNSESSLTKKKIEAININGVYSNYKTCWVSHLRLWYYRELPSEWEENSGIISIFHDMSDNNRRI